MEQLKNKTYIWTHIHDSSDIGAWSLWFIAVYNIIYIYYIYITIFNYIRYIHVYIYIYMCVCVSETGFYATQSNGNLEGIMLATPQFFGGLLSVRYWVDLVIQMLLSVQLGWQSQWFKGWKTLSSLRSNNPRIVVLRVHHVIVVPTPSIALEANPHRSQKRSGVRRRWISSVGEAEATPLAPSAETQSMATG